jgi:hypothetical protein
MYTGPLLPILFPSRALAALSLGCASPKPQPPSRSWATTAPAHFPLRKPQHPAAQSASEVQAPVMNWVPGALAAPSPPAGDVFAGVAGAVEATEATGRVTFASPWPSAFAPPLPFDAFRALLFG